MKVPQEVSTSEPKPRSRRAAFAAFTGTAMEWYDFYLFGTAAALTFGSVFFPSEDPTAGALSSFATFAVGFIARPIGAVIFGHIGDRLGRKRSLMITIWMMGVATTLVGFVPSYDTLGVLAAGILVTLRVIQGIAMGGEWSGASALITEQAPQGQRGFYAMLPQLGNPLGILLGTLAFSITSWLLNSGDFETWGWRIPFLLALPFMLVIIWLRRALSDSTAPHEQIPSVPMVEVLRAHKMPLFIAVGVAVLGVAGYYFTDTFVLAYATRELNISPTPLLNAGLIGSVLDTVLFFGWGLLANRIGGARVGMIGSGATVVLALPVFGFVIGGTTLGVAFAIIAGSALVSISYAASGEVLNGLFPAHIRQTAIGVAYNLAGVVAGITPFLATFVMNISHGSAWWTASLLIGMASITFLSLVWSRRRVDHSAAERATN